MLLQTAASCNKLRGTDTNNNYMCIRSCLHIYINCIKDNSDLTKTNWNQWKDPHILSTPTGSKSSMYYNRSKLNDLISI